MALLNVRIIKIKKSPIAPTVAVVMNIDGKYEETMSELVADAMIEAFGMRPTRGNPTTRLKNNTGYYEYVYS